MISITIPYGVVLVKPRGFTSTEVTNIVVDDRNTVYDSRDNCNAIIETATNTLIVGCPNTVIPNTVTSIAEDAFGWSGCNLTNISIPNSVTSIGNLAFYSCIGLTSIEIPNSVTNIGYNAFSYCEGLTTLTVKATTPPTFGICMLDSCSALTSIRVPAGSVAAYKAAGGWSDFAGIISAIE